MVAEDDEVLCLTTSGLVIVAPAASAEKRGQGERTWFVGMFSFKNIDCLDDRYIDVPIIVGQGEHVAYNNVQVQQCWCRLV